MNFIKKVRENKEFCEIAMPSGVTKILDFNQYQKSDKKQFVICRFCMFNRKDCMFNRKNSSATKVSKHIRSGLSMSTISSFKNIENKHDG